MVIIKRSSIAELESSPQIAELLREYARECAIDGMPDPCAKAEAYKDLERHGALVSFAAYLDDYLIGYINVLSPTLPHYNAVVAVAESFFVSKEYRKTGAGDRLRKVAEQYAQLIGSPGLLISTPFGGQLEAVLPYKGYTKTNTVFFKSFSKTQAVAVIGPAIPAMTEVQINRVKDLEKYSLQQAQVDIGTDHLIHAGMYARTIMIPAGIVLTGALIKIATMLIVSGDIIAYIGDETIELNGYNVLPASANRKQAFVAKTDVRITMIFNTEAKTVEEAEEEFTDDSELLMSRSANAVNHTIITGE